MPETERHHDISGKLTILGGSGHLSCRSLPDASGRPRRTFNRTFDGLGSVPSDPIDDSIHRSTLWSPTAYREDNFR